MRLLFFSDLHLEHGPNWRLPDRFPEFDVCVSAGDIAGSPVETIRLLSSHHILREKPIVIVPGNHEFYHNTLEDEIEKGKAAADETGVNFLDGTAVIIDGVRFCGGILWSDFSLMGNRAIGLDEADRGMNDFRLIKRRAYKAGHPGRWRFAAKDAAWHHARYRAAIEQILAEPFNGPSVVVTHHAPSRHSLDPRCLGDSLNAAYASDLEALMLQWKPALWLHGHVHVSVNYTVGETRVRSNPKGYGPHPEMGRPDIQNPAFDPCLTIDVPTPSMLIEGTQRPTDLSTLEDNEPLPGRRP